MDSPNQLTIAQKTLIGNSVCLVPISHAAQFFPGYKPNALTRVMHALGVPLLYDKRGAHFNLYTLEAILHYLLYPGGPGIVLPASKYKLQSKHLRPGAPCTKLGVSDDDILAADSEEWRQRRITTGLNIWHRRSKGTHHRQLHSKPPTLPPSPVGADPVGADAEPADAEPASAEVPDAS